MNASAVAAAPAPVAAAISNLFVTVPAATLPNGTVVPAFQVGQYLCSRGDDGLPAVTREGTPWVDIDYHAARAACAAAGWTLISELQALALAHTIAQHPANWSESKVGKGSLGQGLHKGTVDAAQPGTYESADPAEDRWFMLADGQRVYDVAGNAFTWVYDDVQGDAEGVIAKPFAGDSPSITTAPFPSEKRGMGWYPKAGRDWAGDALVRGGYWSSGSGAGVFHLSYDGPGSAYVDVGFRCTKPIGL